MKFKRIISKSLIIAVLLNSGLTPLASAMLQDGRYETFEGDNISIDNILEEDKVDVEIEGSTLVNLAYGEFEIGGNSQSNHVFTENSINATITQ